jgi:hypothetical protein
METFFLVLDVNINVKRKTTSRTVSTAQWNRSVSKIILLATVNTTNSTPIPVAEINVESANTRLAL